MTQASFLATHATSQDSNPVRRGAVVLKRLLCDEVPPPPNEDIPPPEPPKPGVTTRERFAKHDESMCATCHKLTDPIGFSFENYDAIGAYRQTDQGKPVDATGSLELEGQQLRFNNVDRAGCPRWPDRRRCKPAWPGSGCATCCAGRRRRATRRR